MTRDFTDRFAAWLEAHRIAVLVAGLAVLIAGAAVTTRLHLQSDLTNLLPDSQPSVKSLNAIRERARPFGTLHVVIESSDPAKVKRAASLLATDFGGFPPALVAQVVVDSGPRDRYGWKFRFLFADLADLTAARDALRAKIDSAKLNANPLFIGLDDDPPPALDTDRLGKLETKLDELEKRATTPPPRISADGTLQQISLQTNFGASDIGPATRLTRMVQRSIAAAKKEIGPGLDVGLTGNITLALHEHDSVLDGMTRSLVITLLLVGIALVTYYRSGKLVLAMLFALAVGVMITFALAQILIGHLNIMTAFLFAIVIGNGINAGLILVARFLEDLRDATEPRVAIASAIRHAVPGTLAAAATAAVAYASLAVTDFRGFRQFGAIGGIGMAATWLTTFTVLPALLFVLARRGYIKRTKPPALGAWLAKLHPRSDKVAVMVFGVVTAIALVIATRYIARDPFTRDWRDLQSSTPAIETANALSAKVKVKLPASSDLTGQAYTLVYAVDKRADVEPLVTYLRQADKQLPEADRWIRDVFSINDLVPQQQPEKLAVLAEIRTMLDDPAVLAEMPEADRARLLKLRPPEDLRAVVDADIPAELVWPFVEKNGTLGRLVVLRGASRLDSFNVDHRRYFAAEARALKLPVHAIFASESLVVADIIVTMEADAPKMILFALIGSTLAVLLVLGFRRHGIVTVACGLAGVVAMIAACALAGLPVHFLDLIALPITIGIGVDYAVNIAARDRQEGDKGPDYLLRTVGSTVVMCSYTTSVGYGTLLLSANGGIRAFGLAALLGEVACVAVALIATPALLAVLRKAVLRKRAARES